MHQIEDMVNVRQQLSSRNAILKDETAEAKSGMEEMRLQIKELEELWDEYQMFQATTNEVLEELTETGLELKAELIEIKNERSNATQHIEVLEAQCTYLRQQVSNAKEWERVATATGYDLEAKLVNEVVDSEKGNLAAVTHMEQLIHKLEEELLLYKTRPGHDSSLNICISPVALERALAENEHLAAELERCEQKLSAERAHHEMALIKSRDCSNDSLLKKEVCRLQRKFLDATVELSADDDRLITADLHYKLDVAEAKCISLGVDKAGDNQATVLRHRVQELEEFVECDEGKIKVLQQLAAVQQSELESLRSQLPFMNAQDAQEVIKEMGAKINSHEMHSQELHLLHIKAVRLGKTAQQDAGVYLEDLNSTRKLVQDLQRRVSELEDGTCKLQTQFIQVGETTDLLCRKLEAVQGDNSRLRSKALQCLQSPPEISNTETSAQSDTSVSESPPISPGSPDHNMQALSPCHTVTESKRLQLAWKSADRHKHSKHQTLHNRTMRAQLMMMHTKPAQAVRRKRASTVCIQMTDVD